MGTDHCTYKYTLGFYNPDGIRPYLTIDVLANDPLAAVRFGDRFRRRQNYDIIKIEDSKRTENRYFNGNAMLEPISAYGLPDYDHIARYTIGIYHFSGDNPFRIVDVLSDSRDCALRFAHSLRTIYMDRIMLIDCNPARNRRANN